MCLYRRVSLLAPECASCVCVCVISNQSTSKKPHYVSDLSRFDALFHKTYIKVLLLLRYQGLIDMCRSILSLTKIAHQMWYDRLFRQCLEYVKTTCSQQLPVMNWITRWYYSRFNCLCFAKIIHLEKSDMCGLHSIRLSISVNTRV